MTLFSINRRDFVKSSAVLGSALILPSPTVKGSQANSKITVGVIGLGGRGSLIAGFLKEHSGFQITAVADYFPNVSSKAGESMGVDAKRCFSGLLGYQRLIDSKVDAVFLETPPYECHGLVSHGGQ
jgi:myo-inositol 2-dehydrogenase/D-chiro-inositol 1-dehydrogenase